LPLQIDLHKFILAAEIIAYFQAIRRVNNSCQGLREIGKRGGLNARICKTKRATNEINSNAFSAALKCKPAPKINYRL